MKQAASALAILGFLISGASAQIVNPAGGSGGVTVDQGAAGSAYWLTTTTAIDRTGTTVPLDATVMGISINGTTQIPIGDPTNYGLWVEAAPGSALLTALQAGTAISAASMPAGGSGLLGWDSAIYEQLYGVFGQPGAAWPGAGAPTNVLAALWGIANILNAGTIAPGTAIGTLPFVGVGARGMAQEPTPNTDGQGTWIGTDLTGKVITSPYANRENMKRGVGTQAGTGSRNIMAAPATGLKYYVTSVQCRSLDATAYTTVTLNDTASTPVGAPIGGMSDHIEFPVPLAVPVNTALTFTTTSSIAAGVQCSAQAFTGY